MTERGVADRTQASRKRDPPDFLAGPLLNDRSASISARKTLRVDPDGRGPGGAGADRASGFFFNPRLISDKLMDVALAV
ncbi:MAG: hypothetical protein LBJ64_03035 [Deltaproteobacteria bacterium]|jgi:hypothetical protein|nr:hypothetical protein [Deltaproteobacteria bacterium]